MYFVISHVWLDKSYTGRCHRGTKKQNDRLFWLWRQSTALYPSIYLPQRLSGSVDAALMVRYREPPDQSSMNPKTHMTVIDFSLKLHDGHTGCLRSYWWTFLSPSLRHTLLEALRVASVWRHGNTSNHATPVLPYARLAFTHTLAFLNKVGFVATHKAHTVHAHANTCQFIS